MPIYEYRCESCGASYEEQKDVVDRDDFCDICGACDGTIKRVIGDCTFRLKGSCWAKDGYSRLYGDAVKHQSK